MATTHSRQSNHHTMERPLGISEKLMYKMRDYGGLNVCGVAHIKGNIDTTRLQSALLQVVAENPILNCTTQTIPNSAKNNESETYFTADNDFQLPLSEITVKNTDDLYELISTELYNKTNDNKKLWRLQLVHMQAKQNTCYLLATFDHTIIDGKSSYKFIELLLNAYQENNKDSTLPQEFISTPAEWSTNHKIQLSNILRFIKHEARKLFRPLTPLTFSATAKSSERKTQLVKISFTKQQTQDLIIKSRECNTTVQGAIVAALFFSSARHACEANNNYRFCNSSPIDFRKDFNISDTLIGNYSSSIETIHTLSSTTSFWSLAREIREKLIESKNNNLHLSSLVIFEYLQNLLSDKFRVNLLEGKPMGRLCTTNVSNLGKIDLKQHYGDISIEDFSATVGQHGFGANICLFPSTFNGSLSFFLHYVTPLTTRQQALNIQESIIELLVKSLKSDFTYQESIN